MEDRLDGYRALPAVGAAESTLEFFERVYIRSTA
jgi:hypothetical protein